jgi:hypothetical protein
MKNIDLISSILFSSLAFSQSKKEQIQTFNNSLNGTQTILVNERARFTSKINELEISN